MKKFALALFAGSILAGCAYTGVKDVERADFMGESFTQLLAKEYKNYAMFEAYDMADWGSAEFFADKAMAAGAGEMVMPSELPDRDLPDFSIEDLAEARAKLMSALTNLKDVDGNVPHLAKAQASFDCWMEQQEENIQEDDIADCRVHFEDAMSKLKHPHVIVEETFRVFFDNDSAELSEDAMEIIMNAKAFIGEKEGTSILLTGATDTTGSVEYNKKLSAKRAQTVYDAMMAAAIPEHKVDISAEGEEDLLVKTEDDVSEMKNRRVDIMIIR